MFTSKPQKLQRSPADISALCDIKITVKNEKLIRCNIEMSGVEVSTEMDTRLQNAEHCLYMEILKVLNHSEITPKSRCHIYGAPTSLGCADCTTPYCTVNCQAKDTSHFLYCRLSKDDTSDNSKMVVAHTYPTLLPGGKFTEDSDSGLWVVDVAAVVEATPASQPPAPSETVVTLPSPCATSQPPAPQPPAPSETVVTLPSPCATSQPPAPQPPAPSETVVTLPSPCATSQPPAPQPPAPSETVVTLPSPCATSQPKTNYFSCSFLPEGTFSTVTIVHQNSVASDQYFVGPMNILEMHNDMNKHFANMTASGRQLMTPKIGEIGICKFEGIWYRVKVESLAPVLTVFYMDYGNTDPTTAEELRECPESHKNIPALVRQIKLGTGISEKFFNLEPFSSISIKPVSSLDDGTIVVHVEGETYNAMLKEAEVSKPLSPAPETKLSQMPSPVLKTAPVQGNETSSVFSSSVGKIIGRTDSGADIKVKKASDSNLTEITLRGSKESQAKAKELTNELVDDSRGRDTNTSFYGDSGFKQSGGFSVIPFLRRDENGCLEEIDFDEVNRLHVNLRSRNTTDKLTNPIGFIQELCQRHNAAKLPEYMELPSAGQDHCKEFHYKCLFDGFEVTGKGIQKQQAKSDSAKMMISLLEENKYFDELINDDETSVPNKIQPVHSATSNLKNPISALQEHCQQNKVVPVYTFRKPMGSHIKKVYFIYECSLGDLKSCGTGYCKKTAQTQSAANMCEILNIPFSRENDEKNAISALQEFCAHIKSLPDPVYENKPDSLDQFVVVCNVGSLSAEGKDSTKKGAKLLAAKRVLNQLINQY